MVDFESVLLALSWIVLLGFAATIGFFLLNGRIYTRGLLTDKKTGRFSPERLQLLVITLGYAGYYFLELVSNPDRLPEVSDTMLLVLSGSHLGYLGPKAWRFFKNNTDQGDKHG